MKKFDIESNNYFKSSEAIIFYSKAAKKICDNTIDCIGNLENETN